jgi:hypothetical protein
MRKAIVEVQIITPWDGAWLMKSAQAGDETAMVVLGSIKHWLKTASSEHCIGCKALFDDDARPGVFAVATFDKSGVMTAGICQQCVDGGDLQQIVKRALPNARPLGPLSEAGHG